MKVINLTEKSTIYTSNVFYALGDWNAIDDTNTLIDVGSDPSIIDLIENTHTGLGKNKIDQVIITHSHSDHVAVLPLIIEKYKPKIYAFNGHLKGVDHSLKDGDIIKIAEKSCEVFHITSHSHDSICIYCKENQTLFAGDTYFPIEFENESLKNANKYVTSRLEPKAIKMVYYGHGPAQDYSQKKFIVTK